MANKKEQAQVDVIVNGQKANASIKDMEAVSRALRAQWRGLNTDSPDFKKVDADLKKVNKSLAEAKGASAKMNSSFGELKSLLPTISLATLVRGLVSIGKQMFNVRSEFQKYEAVLKNTFGSEERARQSMNMLQETAVLLPVSVKDLTEAFVKLANRGFVPTQKEIIKLNDIASSTGKSLDMFVEAMLDAQTGEFERLKEFGIRAKSEGDKVTFTFKGQATTVEKTDEAIKNYMLSLGDLKGVSGSSAAIMDTFAGKVSNIGDSWDNLLNNMGKNTEGFVSQMVSSVGYWVQVWAEGSKSIKQIQEEVNDKQAAANYENAMKEIDIIADGLVKRGMERQAAQSHAADLYRSELEQSIQIAKDALTTEVGVEKEKLAERVRTQQGELDSVNAHFMKLKEIEDNKSKLTDQQKKEYQKQLDDKKKFLEDILKSGLTATEKENADYQEKLKKAEGNAQAIEIIERLHKENLAKIAEDGAEKIKSARAKHIQDELKDYDESDQAVLNLLKQRYVEELKAAGDNVDKRKAIEEKYQNDVLTTELAQLEGRRATLVTFGESTIAIEKAINDKKLEILKGSWKDQDQAEKDTKAIRKEYNLQSTVEQEAEEIAALQAHYANKELTTQEYEQALLQIKLQYAQEYVSQYQGILNQLSEYIALKKQSELDGFNTEKDAELKKLEEQHNQKLISDDVYEKKKGTLDEKYKKKENDLRKKYADKEFAVKAASIIASTAQGIMMAFATLPTIAAIAAAVLVGATGTLQLANANAERQKIKQLAKGQYDVIGASDNQLYTDVPFGGQMQTGIYNRQVLLAENDKPELVVDNPTLRNIQFNAPDIIPRIMANRVTQYADGKYPETGKQTSQTDVQLIQTITALVVVMNRLNGKIDNIYAKVIMDEFKQVEADWNAQKQDVAK
jgi:hypothetical protein